MSPSRLLRNLAILSISITCLAPARASERSSRHDLSVSAGIASPSATSAVYQNAAGLGFNTRTRVEAHSGFGDDDFSSHAIGAGVTTGNGGFGAAAGVTHFSGTPATSAAFYGLGIQSRAVALGVAGFTSLSSGGGSSFNAGILIGPMEKTRFGITVMDFTRSSREFGFGLSHDLDTTFSIVADAAMDSDFNDLALQPGLIARGNGAALTVSYGFNASGRGGTYQVADGFTVGGSLSLSQRVSLQLYHKQLYRYYAELVFAL